MQVKDKPRLQASNHLVLQKSYSNLVNRCRQSLDEGDNDYLDSYNLPGVLPFSIAATSATTDLVARQPVCTLTFGSALQLET